MTTRYLFSLMLLLSGIAQAEQSKRFDDVEVHYVVVNTLFLRPDVASRYHIVRGKDRAIVNVSVMDSAGNPMPAEISGTTINLLSQQAPLEFEVFKEEQAIYYIAPFRYTDQDVLRFRITALVAERDPMELEFQQQMHVANEP